MKNIRTKIQPKEIYNRSVQVRYRGEDVTANLQVVDEDIDLETKIYSYEIGLSVSPKPSDRISLNTFPTKDGTVGTKVKIIHRLIQQEFDAVMTGQKIIISDGN